MHQQHTKLVVELPLWLMQEFAVQMIFNHTVILFFMQLVLMKSAIISQEQAEVMRVITNTGNNIPIITAMNNNGANIPVKYTIYFNSYGYDPDGDPLTYSWEEWDLGPSTTWNGGNTNTTSLFLNFARPKTTGSRTFPDSSLILANYTLSHSDLNGLVMDGNKGETLPTGCPYNEFQIDCKR